MAWALRASSTAGAASGGNLTIDKPTGTLDNDLLVVTFYTETSGRITTLSGWTKIGEAGPSFGPVVYCTTYYKRASSEGSNYTWVLSGTGWRTAVMSAWSGGLTSGTFMDVAAGKAAPDDTSYGYGDTITTTAANDLGVIGISDYDGDGTTVGTSGYTEAVDFGECALYYATIASAGATGIKQLADSKQHAWATYHAGFFIASEEPPAGRTTYNTDPRPLGINAGISRRVNTH